MTQATAAGTVPGDLSQLEAEAAKVLSPEALAYILAGAGDADTTRANAAAFRRWKIKRRKGGKPVKVDLSTTVLGTRMPAPVLFAPVGVQTLAHLDGELASARAAAELGLTYVHSTQAAYPMEEVAAANGDGPRWYQLYWPTDDELAVSFLRRAKAAGYTHLVITLDTTLLGWRPLDLDRGYSPFLENRGIANYTSDPVFRRQLIAPAELAPLPAGIAFAGVFQNPGLSWEQLPLIRANWDGPILLKGIQSPRDARLAAEHKIDGIVVSNHGGRQVDGAIASLDALGPIVKAVGDEMPVLFDSGIRTGRDAFKALALGADAVLVGRPYLYGLALNGQTGTREVMRSLLDELEDEVGKAGPPQSPHPFPLLPDPGALKRRPDLSESTRRQFLEAAGTAAAVTVLAPSVFAAGLSAPAPALAKQSPLPVGPGAPYGSYQSEIYLAGMTADVKPIFTTNLSDLEAAATKALPEAARRHLLAWAGGAAAVRANARALQAWRIVPRMFIDRDERDLSATVLGVTMPAPVILGPVGGQVLAHPDGEAATARAAAALGLTYVHASRSSTSVEGVALAAPTGSRWFGLDWPDGRGPDLALLRRAQLAGCTHLVLSPPQPGRRWAALAEIREAWDGPIILGGIQTVPDARTAVRRGFDGIVVSNERGRRGQGPAGTIHVLPRIADAVSGKVSVMFGSGVRTGTDVYRALALGAEAVLIGRPYVHGLALRGEPGVRHMLRTLLAELEITLAIAGVGDHRELDPSALIRA